MACRGGRRGATPEGTPPITLMLYVVSRQSPNCPTRLRLTGWSLPTVSDHFERFVAVCRAGQAHRVTPMMRLVSPSCPPGSGAGSSARHGPRPTSQPMARPSVAAFGPEASRRLRPSPAYYSRWEKGTRPLRGQAEPCCKSLLRVFVCSRAPLSQRCPGVFRTARCQPVPVRNCRADGS